MSTQTILVTGANTGIGLALCKQLTKDHGAKVYLGSRNADKGKAAVEEVKAHAGANADVELVVIDVGSDDSVKKAAESLKGVTLTAIVNNAGTGLSHGVSGETILNVNFMGVKRVVDNFLPLLNPAGSRIVNVSSGSGPMYVKPQPEERQKIFCNPDITWEEIESIFNVGYVEGDPADAGFLKEYGLSKALLNSYTMYLAKKLQPKNVLVFSLTPGFIATNITKGFSGAKPAEEGTVSIRHCLFETTKENAGWFYGSDAKRSPLHYLRNPGEPEYDGMLPWEKEEAFET